MSKFNTKHLDILSETELSLLYDPPFIPSTVWVEYFTLPENAREAVCNLADNTKAFFILQWGYFQATHQFHTIDIDNMKTDLIFIIKSQFKNKLNYSNLKVPSRTRILNIKKIIINLSGYTLVGATQREQATKKANQLVMSYGKPKIIFKELLKYFERHKWITPSYSVMQDLVGRAMTGEQKRLCKKLNSVLSKKIKVELNQMMEYNDGVSDVTLLQKDVKNFGRKEIKQEIARQEGMASIYCVAKKITPLLKISKSNISYYASLVDYYDVAKLSRMPNGILYLYLICYVYHRAQKINDNLIISFIYKVSKIYEEAKEHGQKQFMTSHKDFVYEKEKLGTILSYFCENSLQGYKFRTISKRAYKIAPKDLIIKISKMFLNETKKEIAFRWEYFSTKYRVVSTNIKPLFMAIDFDCDSQTHPTLKAAAHLKEFFMTKKSISKLGLKSLPMQFIPKVLKSHVEDDGCIDPHKYIFLVYYRLMKLLINNKVYVNDSLSFKSFSEDISVTSDWKNKQAEILEKLALPKLSAPLSDRLEELETVLEQLYVRVNDRIASGENEDVSINPDGSWTIKYHKCSEDYEAPFFRKLPQVNIGGILDMVNEQCNFMRCFEHHAPRYNNKEVPHQLLKAAIIAVGTWQGTYNMAARSNLKFNELSHVEKSRLKIKTIKDACDVITKEIEKLDHFQLRNTCSNGYHGGMDGSKHVTKKQTIQARYSSKYFGLQRGIVSLNMVINEVPVNCDIIGANEYEGHYLYDIYHGNSSGLDPAVFSTDTAGSNLINFLILDHIDVTFAPAYKSMYKRSSGLVGFKDIKSYKDLLICPVKKVPKTLILNHDSEIKKILASLYLNETEQHVIVQKLCCRERQTNLKKALWAYNDILFSIHFLHYIDDREYKQAIRKTLNRGEAYNRLYNAVVNIGNKKIRGLNLEETKIWGHCTRLLTLIITYYNSYMLSEVIASRKAKGDEKGAELLSKISPMASRHINLSGNYHYSDDAEGVNLDEIVQKLNLIVDELI